MRVEGKPELSEIMNYQRYVEHDAMIQVGSLGCTMFL